MIYIYLYILYVYVHIMCVLGRQEYNVLRVYHPCLAELSLLHPEMIIFFVTFLF